MEIVMTNRMFINTMLDPEDVTKILRVWDWYLERRCDKYAPIWVKESLYYEWLDSPFDSQAWASAGIQRSMPGSIPKDYGAKVRKFLKPIQTVGKALHDEGKRTKELEKSGKLKHYIITTREDQLDEDTAKEVRITRYGKHGGATIE